MSKERALRHACKPGVLMCGLAGIYLYDREIGNDMYIALLAEEHRGKESVGAVTAVRENFEWRGGVGKVPDNEAVLSSLRGHVGIGHVRYGTSGSTLDIKEKGENQRVSDDYNIQPIRGVFHEQEFYIAHNGNLVNTEALRKETKSEERASDTKIIAKLISQMNAPSFESALFQAVYKLRGAFCLLVLYKDIIYAIRDPYGFHPLQLGKYKNGYIIASESCVFDHVGAQFLSDIEPGHTVILTKDSGMDGPRFHKWSRFTFPVIDIFEYIYFLRPDSVVEGVEAGVARERMGYYLAYEHPIPQADLIIPMPDSANQAALGYARGMKEQGFLIDFNPWAIFRPHTGVGRTFIESQQETREELIRSKKINVRKRIVHGKNIVVIDDSLIRGTTFKEIARKLRDTGVRSVSAEIASPMYLYEDVYGIDTHRVKKELIAKQCDGCCEKIREKLGLDHLGYLSMEKTIRAVLDSREDMSFLRENAFYTGPFTGDYPAGIS